MKEFASGANTNFAQSQQKVLYQDRTSAYRLTTEILTKSCLVWLQAHQAKINELPNELHEDEHRPQ